MRNWCLVYKTPFLGLSFLAAGRSQAERGSLGAPSPAGIPVVGRSTSEAAGVREEGSPHVHPGCLTSGEGCSWWVGLHDLLKISAKSYIRAGNILSYLE